MATVPISSAYVRRQMNQAMLEKKIETVNNIELTENENKQVVVQERRPFYNYFSNSHAMLQSSVHMLPWFKVKSDDADDNVSI